ncbi:MAG: uroporphyrinogen decarboxylase family protein [Planctomycetota bacterium]
MRTLDFKTVDMPWVRWGSFIWDQTIKLWHSQGYKGQPLDDYFGLDQLVRVDPWYGPVPPFERKVVEEDDHTITYINHEGILMREFKEHADTSMPQFLKFPVESPEDFEKLASERLTLNRKGRFTKEWKQQVAAGGRAQARVGKDTDSAKSGKKTADADRDGEQWPSLCWADRWGGFFGSLRNLMGVQGICCAFYDQPKLVDRMMAERADSIIEITEEVLKYTTFDTFWFWEDMAYNNGPLVGPELFSKFAMPYYKKVCQYLRSKGIRHIGLDSDGDIRLLIPLWLEAGINLLWPFEVQSNMDVVQVRKTYGHDLAMMGGINKKEIAKGGDAMRSEVDRVMPLVEDGGYIPELDHSVPPDITWQVFCEYIDYLKYRLGRG